MQRIYCTVSVCQSIRSGLGSVPCEGRKQRQILAGDARSGSKRQAFETRISIFRDDFCSSGDVECVATNDNVPVEECCKFMRHCSAYQASGQKNIYFLNRQGACEFSSCGHFVCSSDNENPPKRCALAGSPLKMVDPGEAYLFPASFMAQAPVLGTGDSIDSDTCVFRVKE